MRLIKLHHSGSFRIQATANSSEIKHLQTGDMDYKEASAAAAVRNKIEMGGVTAEQNAATIKVITAGTRIIRSTIYLYIVYCSINVTLT